jgi:hypothetical protein
MYTVSIEVDERPQPFELDLAKGTWRHPGEEIAEAEFPLITWVDEKRYELYSDGTLSQEDPPAEERAEEPATA